MGAGFTVDPDGLRAMGAVARRQEDHLRRVDDYILTTCNRTAAFTGILNIFQGSYEEAVRTASDGMADSRQVAAKIDRILQESAADYLASDRNAFRLVERAGGDLGQLSYQAPGSGNDVPGEPTETTTPAETPEPEKDDGGPIPNPITWAKDQVPGVPDAFKDPYEAVRDRLMEDPDTTGRSGGDDKGDPHGLIRDPLGTLADKVTEPSNQHREDRLYEREYDRQMNRDSETYWDEYSRARQDGASPDDARSRGDDAIERQHEADRDTDREVERRRGAMDDIGAYGDALDEVEGIVDNTNKIIDNVAERNEALEDRDEYADYAAGPEDTSAEDWGKR